MESYKFKIILFKITTNNNLKTITTHQFIKNIIINNNIRVKYRRINLIN